MLWFNFILGLNFIFFCFKIIITNYHTQKQKKIQVEPRIQLNHNIYIVAIKRQKEIQIKKRKNYLISPSASYTSSLFVMVNSSSPLHPTFSNSSSSRRFTIPFSKSSTKERKFSVV